MNNNIYRIALQTSVAALILSLFACASPAPVEEPIYQEPVAVANEPVYEPAPVSEPYDPNAMQNASMSDSVEANSGVSAPVEESSFSAPTIDTIDETPSGYYGIQVVASSSYENMNAFATEHGLSTVLSTTVFVNGKEWHVLLAGVYTDLEEAKAALAEMQSQYSTSPWIRQISTLQK